MAERVCLYKPTKLLTARKREMDEQRDEVQPFLEHIQREQWIISFEETLMRSIDLAGPSPNLSIYRVTSSLAEHKKDAYTPNTISLGPYHSNMRLDQEKGRALHSFLLKNPAVSFRLLAMAVARVEEKLKSYYEMLDDQWGEPNRFLEMMITDGFFVLAVLCFLYFKINPFHPGHQLRVMGKIALSFGQLWGSNFIPQIRRDMLLLENQLPILLLQTLMEALGGEARHVKMLILSFLDLEPEQLDERNDAFLGFHILDVYRRKKVSKNYSLQKNQSMHSATDLDMAGVCFCKNNSNYLNDISFSRGTLRLPCIDIDDTTKVLLLNLMAFERLRHDGISLGVTYYVYFMRELIHSSRDVALLRKNDIIKPHKLSDNDVIEHFKEMSEGIFIDPDSYEDKKLDCYLKSWWRIQQVKFARMSFFILEKASPEWLPAFLRTQWAVLAVFAGLFYFTSNILQTLYTIFPFYGHNK